MLKYSPLILFLLLIGCDSIDRASVATTYADIAYASYEDSYNAAVLLDQAIDVFVADPTQATMDAARRAWLDARDPYGQTEAYRYAGGPIDDADGPEGLLNAWPLDEAYVDYVEGDASAGIINNVASFPTIDANLLASLNEIGAEENVSTGYHAIEFLLWGQDLSETSAGNRPVTDYTTEANAGRRKLYLAAASDLLLVHLNDMVTEWNPNVSGNYRSTFLALDSDQAVRNMLTGLGTLAKSELAVERIFVAVNNQDQEDEQSCFSDNTHRDIITNAEGIANVYNGVYNRTDGSIVSGPSMADLVNEANESLGTSTEKLLTDALASVSAIPVPFDQAIINQQSKVLAAVDALQTLGDGFVVVATELGISINTALPD